MQHEIRMASEQQKKHGLPVREKPPTESVPMEITNRRRLLRIEIKELIEALKKGDMTEFSIRMGRVAFSVAGTCAQFGTTPDWPQYVEAVSAQIEEAHSEIDKALQASNWWGVAIAAAKLQVVWMGCAANTGLPYGELVTYLHDCYMNSGEVDIGMVTMILKKAGLQVDNEAQPGGAANDA